jgi:hypothetical protein
MSFSVQWLEPVRQNIPHSVPHKFVDGVER